MIGEGYQTQKFNDRLNGIKTQCYNNVFACFANNYGTNTSQIA